MRGYNPAGRERSDLKPSTFMTANGVNNITTSQSTASAMREKSLQQAEK